MERELIYIGIFICIIIITITVAYLVNRFFRKLILNSTLVMQNDPTNYHFFRHTLVALIYIIGFSIAVYMMPDLRALASSLLAGAGILAVAVGFASQHALSNIISGVFIVVFKPFRIKDRLQVQQWIGLVEDITLRHTVIRDFENKRILIPNAIISNEVIINSDFDDSRINKWIDVGISYDSDITRAKEIIHEEIMNHPLHIDGRTEEQIEKGDPEVPVRVISLGEYSVHIRGWSWASNAADAFAMSCDLNESIKRRFDEEGIEIPFPYRTITYKEKPSKDA